MYKRDLGEKTERAWEEFKRANKESNRVVQEAKEEEGWYPADRTERSWKQVEGLIQTAVGWRSEGCGHKEWVDRERWKYGR